MERNLLEIGLAEVTMTHDKQRTSSDIVALRRRHCIVITPQVSWMTRRGRQLRAVARRSLMLLSTGVSSALGWFRDLPRRWRAHYRERTIDTIHRVVQASLSADERERFAVGRPRDLEHLARAAYRVRTHFVSRQGEGFSQRCVLVSMSGVRWRRIFGIPPAVSLLAREHGRALTSAAPVLKSRRLVLGPRTMGELSAHSMPCRLFDRSGLP